MHATASSSAVLEAPAAIAAPAAVIAHRTLTSVPTSSPWGPVESHEILAPGIVSVITPGHGGIHLDDWRQRQMPAALRRASGWYEEDEDWCKPVVAFSREMPAELSAAAHQTLKLSFPEAWDLVFGEQYGVKPAQVAEARAFYERHRDDYIARASWGADEAHRTFGVTLGAGEVLVQARRGVDCMPPRPGSLPWEPDEAFFRVDRDRLLDHPSEIHGLVIDPRADRLVEIEQPRPAGR